MLFIHLWKNLRKEVVVSKGVPFSFSFEGSDMRVEGEEEEEGWCP